ncbi:MAG: hypothetical protein JJE39_07840 [Vicinamibacteria bacterium]|nr:hypothetical protein [Vicinamibacteria bacterium]
MKRRDLLKLGATAAALAAPGVAAKEPSQDIALDFLPRGLTGLWPVAQAVLPKEIGAAGQKEALAAFVTWIHDHDAGRYLEHGYGHTRVAKSAAAPVEKYRAQLQALGAAARRRHGKGFGALDLAARRALLVEAFVALKIDGLGERPSGRHVATALMSHYFSSIEANDLCYEAEIGRDSCRSLAGSGERPEPLAKAARS